MFKKYDSTKDTLDHIQNVQRKLGIVICELYERSVNHDASKLQEPEKSIFDKYTPKLKSSTYGSEEYKKFLEEMRPALNHHYMTNRHHPEYFDHHCATGFTGEAAIYHMNLIDVVEMFCDWAAAVERHEDGDLKKSINISADRFHLDEQLVSIFNNTVDMITKKD